MTLTEWANKWGVPPQCLTELITTLDYVPNTSTGEGMSEASVQQRVNLESSRLGARLFRNNVGACVDDNGNHVRYGLANVSVAQNKRLKSSDLIGITPLLIQQHHVGTKLGIFTALEVKKSDWKMPLSPNAREKAQLNFINLIRLNGGFADFINDPSKVSQILNR